MSVKAISKNSPQYAAHAIRFLAMDGVQAANSGHPGMPMGMADIATVLWNRFLSHNPANPKWFNRDRFVLSNGHGSMLLYSLLHLSGYDLPIKELRSFRQLHSKTPGHPEYGHTVGVEVTTGPLGQGISMAVGLALGERWLAARFNRPKHNIVSHYTYVFVGDGCMMEGISHESCSLAGHLGLGKMIVFYDNNHISIDGDTNLSYSDDATARFAAYGWHVQEVDGHDHNALEKAIKTAQQEQNRPSLISCRTIIGWGSPNKAGTAQTHGSPLGEGEIKATREALHWDARPFQVPKAPLEFWRKAQVRGKKAEQDWSKQLKAYIKAYPQEGAELERIVAGQPAKGWQAPLAKLRRLLVNKPPATEATRVASGMVLDAIGTAHADLLGGSADLTPSNNTRAVGFSDIAPGSYNGKYVRYGVREHGMAAVMNGLAAHGGIVPYAGTFAVFSDYLRPAMRLSALMGLQVVYVFTHDSIGLGEDGPTHQPVEHYMACRAIPNLHVYRPCDVRETAACWAEALKRKNGPAALLLTRQKLTTFPGTESPLVAKGGYVLSDAPEELELQVLLLATGSEVELAMAAQRTLNRQKIGARVVSLPCWDAFAAQPQAYREQVLPPEVTARVGVEAGIGLGWGDLLGIRGIFVGMKGFGASAPYDQLYKHFGITSAAVVRAAKSLL